MFEASIYKYQTTLLQDDVQKLVTEVNMIKKIRNQMKKLTSNICRMGRGAEGSLFVTELLCVIFSCPEQLQ